MHNFTHFSRVVSRSVNFGGLLIDVSLHVFHSKTQDIRVRVMVHQQYRSNVKSVVELVWLRLFTELTGRILKFLKEGKKLEGRGGVKKEILRAKNLETEIFSLRTVPSTLVGFRR